ncbi:MAG: TPM domain-containing protein, partial [Sphingopyxis sp.]
MARNFILSPADHQRISAAVAQAELQSDGEIATMIARQSDDYHDWALALCAMGALAVPAIIAALPQMAADGLNWLAGGWHAQPGMADWAAATGTVQLALYVLAWLALRWRPLRLALTPRRIIAGRVRQRAIAAYRMGLEARTRAATGILIYISLAEHRAEIVADSAINARVADGDWADAMDQLLANVRARRPADGIIAAVNVAGNLLAT